MLEGLLGGDAIWFGVPALAGTLFFIARVVMMLVIGDIGGDAFDAGDAGDFGGGDGADGVFDDAHSKSPADAADAGRGSTVLRYLSIQALLAFVMGFGWGGLAMYRGLDQSLWLSAFAAVAGGLGMVRLLVWVLTQVQRVNHSGNIARRDYIGSTGAVYVTVPGEGAGQGQVSVVIDGRQRIVSATTSGEALDRHAQVRVVGLNNDNSVAVVAVETTSS